MKNSMIIIVFLSLSIQSFSQESKVQVTSGINMVPPVNNREKIAEGLSSIRPLFPVVNYEGRYLDGDYAIKENKLSLIVPVKKSREEYLALSANLGHMDLKKSLLLSNGGVIPDQYYRAEVGAQYSHQLQGFKNWGFRSTIGYAGDRSVEKMRDATFALNVHYAVPSSDAKALWMYNVFLSNNGPFGNYIPIPGIVYLYKTDTFSGLIGFPITSLQWNFNNKWGYSLFFLGPSVSSEVSFGSVTETQYIFQAAWTNQSYILHNRVEKKDRLTFEEKKISLGVRTFAFDKLKAEIQAGYVFDRITFAGQGMRNMEKGYVKIPADWFVSWNLKSAVF
ncbi:MAG: hypothetical protein ACK41T_07150 [Pseudobdellovibrio sp.]